MNITIRNNIETYDLIFENKYSFSNQNSLQNNRLQLFMRYILSITTSQRNVTVQKKNQRNIDRLSFICSNYKNVNTMI